MGRAFAAIYRSPLGDITLAGSPDALTGLWLEGQKRPSIPRAESGPGTWPLPMRLAMAWLDEYFAGAVPGEAPPLDPAGTAFQKSVWKALLGIGHGELKSYSEVARGLPGGRPGLARAVGGAVGQNPISIIIPCHRVIGANGRLTGYGGGLYLKRRLLALEGSLAKGAKD